MVRQKVLNIHNTDRMFNLNVTTKQEESGFIKVTRLNEAEIEEGMDALALTSGRFKRRDSNNYLLYKERYSNDSLYDKIFDHGGFITYYTTGRVPVPIISKLAGVPQSEVIYYCKKEHVLEDVKNIQLASMATKVTIDVPIVLPDINPYDYLFSLYPLRYHVDKIKLSFPALHPDELQPRHEEYYVLVEGMYHLKANFKYDCFRFLHEPLSTWKMNIWLVCDSDEDKKQIEGMVVRDNKRFRRSVEEASEGGQTDDGES